MQKYLKECIIIRVKCIDFLVKWWYILNVE